MKEANTSALEWDIQPQNITCPKNGMASQNVADLTDAMAKMRREGYTITPELASLLSPYLTGHIKRFGHWGLDMKSKPSPLMHDQDFLDP